MLTFSAIKPMMIKDDFGATNKYPGIVDKCELCIVMHEGNDVLSILNDSSL